MPRLFIFAIGGTGSRVLKSLTMLLASGVKPNSEKDYEIVPIILDPHKSNDDLKRTIRLLDNYQSITKEIGTDNGFFATRINTLNNIVTNRMLAGNFTFNLLQVANTKFKDYIGYSSLDTSSQALTNILFSGKSINKRGQEVDLLDIEMDIGFVGNPNVGSVVLNQFKDSEEFREFASNFDQNDRIFIISSIFGGTGAAGFPTILKNIRGARTNENIDGRGFLENAKIGAITVLPYFNIEKDTNSPIQKSEFISKTRSALHYYKDNITGNNSINALYYIGDDTTGKPYKNDPGDGGQQNDSHFIEVAAALSIINFLEIPDQDLQCENGVALRPIYKEFGIKNDAASVQFSDLEDYTERKLSLRLSQLILFRKYLLEHLEAAIQKQAWSNDKPEIDKTFVDSSFYRGYLLEFLAAYGDWMTELQNNRRAFAPFNLDADIVSLLRDRKVVKGLFSSKVDYHFFDDKLNKHSKSKTFTSSSQKLTKLFYEVTEEILTTKFGLKK